ncbi:hypothetical protein [Spirilliplanes yamanashiensis]|uniref:Uncharacterized protein n=1 Tax=Spirilliplanes yamanashiensis TaxID=42233 RepID=A0A8J4DLE7_9ACTN|nr:hypothetical protein [Spirilliplanes yamanashiensis]MDP9816394.1 hypothetical protein [Spirilliplanes yamanashiensis]GIJ05921.1 hypothetical protein Sya03_52730 [Spirilliplanes yamanashiensis]
MTAGPAGHGLAGVADAGAFLARLVRLERAAPVRLRPAGEHTALWGKLPWNVLVTRRVAGPGPAAGDVTVAAADLLAALAAGSDALPARRDEAWRWPLPPAGAGAVESVSAAELAGLAEAAAGTLREAASAGVGGRSVGQRAIRDALLDHVALTVARDSGAPVEVPQRLVQGVARMGFLGTESDDARPPAQVLVAGTWIGISAPYGVAWLQKATTLTLMPAKAHPFG